MTTPNWSQLDADTFLNTTFERVCPYQYRSMLLIHNYTWLQLLSVLPLTISCVGQEHLQTLRRHEAQLADANPGPAFSCPPIYSMCCSALATAIVSRHTNSMARSQPNASDAERAEAMLYWLSTNVLTPRDTYAGAATRSVTAARATAAETGTLTVLTLQLARVVLRAVTPYLQQNPWQPPHSLAPLADFAHATGALVDNPRDNVAPALRGLSPSLRSLYHSVACEFGKAFREAVLEPTMKAFLSVGGTAEDVRGEGISQEAVATLKKSAIFTRAVWTAVLAGVDLDEYLLSINLTMLCDRRAD